MLGEGCGDLSPRRGFYSDRRPACWPAREGIKWVVLIWRRALAPCIARHFIHPERREGWYDRVSNHFLKAYLQLTAKKICRDLNFLSNHLNFHIHKALTAGGGVSGILQPVIHNVGEGSGHQRGGRGGECGLRTVDNPSGAGKYGWVSFCSWLSSRPGLGTES